MKQINIRKSLLAVAMLGSACLASAQNQPLAFGPKNWYADYVGTSLDVTAPASISGSKGFTTANDGSGTANQWGGTVTTVINANVVLAETDTTACNTPLANGTGSYPSMANSIGLVYRGTCEFGCKALALQNAGAIACIIVNNVPGGPVGMAAASCGAQVNIPVFMISQADGNAIDAAINAGQTVSMTITPWGLGLQNDLGILINGLSISHDYAIPTYQLASTNGNPVPYKNLNGAFIANFGTHDATNVKLTTNVQFTAAGGENTVPVMSDSSTVSSFPAHDSIITMYAPSDYDLHATTNGRYDVTYNLSSAIPDQFAGDNTASYSFYTTTNLYSKGRYDFTNNVPFVKVWEGLTSGTEFTWGPLYYVAKGGYSMQNIQVSIASNDTGVITGSPGMIVYVFKWTDGFVDSVNAIQYPMDSLVEGGELSLVGLAQKTFSGNDSSEEIFTVPVTDLNGDAGSNVILDANSWYWMAADVPAGFFLGCDGVIDYYPRSYGRANNGSGYLEMASMLVNDIASNVNTSDANDIFSPYAFGGSAVTDSIIYSSQNGLIPAIPFTTSAWPASVKTVSQPWVNVKVYPNPVVNNFTVTLGLDKPAKTVSYTLINSVAQFVSRQIHNNVQNNDQVTFSTENLAAGIYYVTIVADGKPMVRKIVVTK